MRVFEPLEEVQPVSKQTNSNTKPAIYGNPDFIVTGEELTKTGSNTDLVNSLVGNVPSMRVNTTGATGQQSIRIRGGAVSGSGSMEPLIMVNGASWE
ncbi:Plug domain-containing protein [Algoriphagus boritolerans]|uniref:Plug domain-containing protein n=1 Tax=Algoriphagus boritolerans TaxID=308111 RepID=UPI000AA3A67C